MMIILKICWWAISELYKKGLLYKGHKILPSCGRCGTAVSSHELAQGYQTKTDITAVAKFYCEELKANILAWTTTPWTLYSNIALCVNAKEEYVIIESRGERFVLAKQLVGKWFDEKQVKIVHNCKGSDLEKLKYTPLFDVANKQEKEKGYKVVCGEFVTLTDGTGVVHIAPTFGEDDNQIGKKYDLPFLQYVNLYGKFTEQVKDFAGKTVFDCNEEIVKKLKEQNKLFASQKFTHEYPHCWRCKTPIMYYARPSWFVKTTAVKDQMVKNNAEVNWIPDNIKEGRMGNFLANNIDWCLSRDRYWGTPLPVWVCDKCGEVEVVGSKAEMLKKGNIKSIKELHKPYVDEVVFNCKCGGKMHREKEVIDCWFDSGAMPFAQHHYPFENKDKFEAMFPAQFISEGIDQTRGWFYTLQALNTTLFGKTPYKTCIANGLVVDEQGRKLSKSLGNYIDPMVLISQFGGDTARWHLLSCTQPYGAPFAGDKVLRESQGKLVSTLWNTYSFFVLYADIDNFDPTKYDILKCKLNIMDKWILSKLNSLILKVTKHLENYESFEASKLCETFADDLSNWYIRRCRKRFWGEGFSEDKQATFTTLHYVLVNFCKILAPFVPFITESIYQNVVANFNKTESESIHLCKYPVEDKKFINTKLEGDMEITYNFCELGRSARSTSNIKIRQPLGKAYVTVAKSDFKLSDEFAQIIKDELNVKDLVVSKDLSSFASYSLKPQLKTIGPKYGKVFLVQFNSFCKIAMLLKLLTLLEAEKHIRHKLADKKLNLRKKICLST
ncbi:soleucyl-trna synthetase [Holotrichia oblita]|nr:soleucyl-trna synthetase [Holotrichia oblita]